MSKIALFMLLCCLTVGLSAQDTGQDYYYHQAKSSTISVGVGFPSSAQVAAKFVSIIDQDASASPQFTLRYEYGINDKIGIGGYGAFYTGETNSISLPSIQLDSLLNDPGSVLGGLFGNNNNSETSSTYRVSVFTLGGFFTYHFYKFEKIDTYSIVRGGYNFISITENGAKNDDFLGADVPAVEYFAGVGARYYVTPKFAINGEVGHSIISPVHIILGATARF